MGAAVVAPEGAGVVHIGQQLLGPLDVAVAVVLVHEADGQLRGGQAGDGGVDGGLDQFRAGAADADEDVGAHRGAPLTGTTLVARGTEARSTVGAPKAQAR